MLKVGDEAPDIDLRANDGKRFVLSERLRGGCSVVLYFFPAAFTPGCTAESKRFRDNAPELAALGADVVGISTDDEQTQCEFAASLAVTFPILADPDRTVGRAYGVLWPIIGKSRRVTFVISPARRIDAVFWHEFQVSRHLDDVVGFLRKSAVAAT